MFAFILPVSTTDQLNVFLVLNFIMQILNKAIPCWVPEVIHTCDMSYTPSICICAARTIACEWALFWGLMHKLLVRETSK